MSTDVNNSNAITATRYFLNKLNVKVTASSVEEALDNHPDFPSLLSISDVLKQWNVDNAALQTSVEKLPELPIPFIAYLRKGGFVVVTEITGDTIHYIAKSDKKAVQQKLSEFEQDWSQVVLAAEANDASGEKNYSQKRKQELRSKMKFPAALTIIFFALVLSVFTNYSYLNTNILTGLSLYTLFSFAGVIVTALLLAYEIDDSNEAVQKICGLTKKTNCGAVLQSKQAKLFNILSWSEVGFFYFSGLLLSLLFAGNTVPVILQALTILNLLALPYTVFSVYYQWKVVKQWCPLCLMVQGLLISQAGSALLFNLYPSSIELFLNIDYTSIMLPAFIFPVLGWLWLVKPALVKGAEAKSLKRDFLKLKFDQSIFNSLLEKQKAIITEPEGLGITLGNPDAKNTIVKVCNPYCGPCAKAHVKIDELLLKNKEVKVQIIFTATTDDKDIKKLPVAHLLALAEKGQEQLTYKSLDDWYLPEHKDYNVFAAKYPLNGELKKQDTKIEQMNKWCEETVIEFTPTFFINGRQLPSAYDISDLEYFLLE